MRTWVADDSLKAENKWPDDGLMRPVRLVRGTPRISTAESHEVEAAPAVSALELSPHLHDALFALHLDPFSVASEELFEPRWWR